MLTIISWKALNLQNLGNDPVLARNFNNLTSEQFSRIIEGIKDGKIKLSYKGTILMDLLAYAKDLGGRGNTSHNAHLAQLQEIAHQASPQKAEVREVSNSSQNDKVSNNAYLLVSGIILFRKW